MSLVLQASVPERDVDVTLEVAAGETCALVGPNGAGKSTVLALIAGMLRPGAGRIALDGRILGAPDAWVPPHARHVTTLTQDPMLFPHLTVLGNIMFGLRAQGMPRRRARAEATRWLGQIDLRELGGRRPSQLSGGQAQRVAVARALAAAPRLLLLDEPMAALDIDASPAVREQLRRFLAERTAIVVTHDVLDAMTLADRTVVLDSGRVVERGETMDVLTRPRSAFAARFAGLNLLTGVRDGQGITLGTGERLSTAAATTAGDSAAGRVAGTGTGPAPGTEVHAVFRPSAVRLLAAGDPPPGSTVLRRTVRVLEPHGDLVRLRAGTLAADLGPQEVAEHRLVPGDTVDLTVDAAEVTVYPAG